MIPPFNTGGTGCALSPIYDNPPSTPQGTHSGDGAHQAFLSWLAARRRASAVFTNNLGPFLRDLGFRAGILTLTFKGNLTDKVQADRAFAKFSKTVLVPHFGAYVRVTERQRRGAWHYHVVVDCLVDVRTGYDFEGHLAPGGSNDPNPDLRRLRRLVREGVSRCGFGFMSKLEPLDLARAQERYLANKIGQGGPSRGRRRHRLISYSRNFPRRWWNGFSLLTDGAFRWRQYVARRAAQLGCEDLGELRTLLGPRWAFNFRRELKGDRALWDSLPGAPAAFERIGAPWE